MWDGRNGGEDKIVKMNIEIDMKIVDGLRRWKYRRKWQKSKDENETKGDMKMKSEKKLNVKGVDQVMG